MKKKIILFLVIILITITTISATNNTTNQTTLTPSKTVVENKTVEYASTVDLQAKITNSKNQNVTGGKVAFKINGITIGYSNITNSKASYKYNTSNLTVGNYTITVVYGQTNKLLSSRANATLTITGLVSIAITNKTTYYTTPINLTATITSKNKTPVNNGYVLFKINGISITKANVTNSKATITFNPNTIASGNYTITGIFSGTSYLNQARSNATLNIKSNNNIKTQNITAYCYDTINITAQLHDNNNKNVTTGSAIIKINMITIATTNIKNGVLSYKYNTSLLGSGKYNITIKYAKNNKYDYTEKTTTLTLKKLTPKITINTINTETNTTTQITAKITDNKSNKVQQAT